MKGNAKVTFEDVSLMLRVAQGLNGSRVRRARILAPIFGLKVNTVEIILAGDAWGCVPRPAPLVRRKSCN